MGNAALKVVSEKTNGGKASIEASLPYAVHVTLEGTSDMLFHRWNCEAVDAKAKAAKNSAAKKTDDIESYVWRNDNNELCIPGEYLRQSIIYAAKFKQDPRSPRKSAMDLFKAGIVPITTLSSLGKQDWDYLHTCRVTVQRAGINRTRPAIKQGWTADFSLQVLLPEYIDSVLLRDVIDTAGRLIGLGDFRPTYGRYVVNNFELSQD